MTIHLSKRGAVETKGEEKERGKKGEIRRIRPVSIIRIRISKGSEHVNHIHI